MGKNLPSRTIFWGLFLSFALFFAATESKAIVSVERIDNEATSEINTSSASSIILEKAETSLRTDITKETEETVESLRKLLDEQRLGPVVQNPLKYAIRASVSSGIAPNTIVLLLLLPVSASLIALGRHLVGVRGFGIFLPASLSVTFLALGPFLGIGIFLLIVALSTGTRFFLKKLKVRLQYLPRMALILWSVAVGVLGVLFLTPAFDGSIFSNISIFPVLILALLAEDFTKVQIGKSVRVAVSLTVETLILALVSYLVLASKSVQILALLHPEAVLAATLFVDILIGRYVGLRVVEFWRFRKLISS